MNEKKIILTEEQLDEALRIAAMGGAGLLHPNDVVSTLEKLPKEVWDKALSSAVAAGCIFIVLFLINPIACESGRIL